MSDVEALTRLLDKAKIPYNTVVGLGGIEIEVLSEDDSGHYSGLYTLFLFDDINNLKGVEAWEA